MIDAVASSSQPFTWGPVIVGILVGMVLALFTFGAWLVRSINQLGKDDITGSKKAHDEIMDNKLATAVLDQKTISLDARVTVLESYHDATLQPKGSN